MDSQELFEWAERVRADSQELLLSTESVIAESRALHEHMRALRIGRGQQEGDKAATAQARDARR